MKDSTAEPTSRSTAAWEEYNEITVPPMVALQTAPPTGMFDRSSDGDAMGFRERTMRTGLHNLARCT